MTRRITRIVVHCSAARPLAASKQTAADIDAMHRRDRGWRKIGYHWFVRVDGTKEKGRDESEIGAGVFGFNANSIHICYAGGLNPAGKAEDTRTHAQRIALAEIIADAKRRHAKARVMGHRDLSPDKDGDGKVEPHEWLKECPCHDAGAWWAAIEQGGAP